MSSSLIAYRRDPEPPYRAMVTDAKVIALISDPVINDTMDFIDNTHENLVFIPENVIFIYYHSNFSQHCDQVSAPMSAQNHSLVRLVLEKIIF